MVLSGSGILSSLGVMTQDQSGQEQQLCCPECGKVLRSRATLLRHIQDLHREQTQQFWCGRCQKSYRTRNSLLVHNSKYHPKNKTNITSTTNTTTTTTTITNSSTNNTNQNNLINNESVSPTSSYN